MYFNTKFFLKFYFLEFFVAKNPVRKLEILMRLTLLFKNLYSFYKTFFVFIFALPTFFTILEPSRTSPESYDEAESEFNILTSKLKALIGDMYSLPSMSELAEKAPILQSRYDKYAQKNIEFYNRMKDDCSYPVNEAMAKREAAKYQKYSIEFTPLVRTYSL